MLGKMKMSLEYAILGFLNYSPMSGYDLKRYFDESVAHFWPATQSQIYRTLRSMEKKGWLQMEVVEQEDRPDRKVYHITDAGREELQRWLREPISLPPVRVAFLIKVFFGGGLQKEEILTQLHHQLALHRERLAAYRGPVREVLQQNIETTGLEREGLLWGLTLDAGIKHEEAWIEWCERAIEEVEKLSE
nr:PadR family transcriptional regulator [Anaerolineae bacterium]